MLCLSLQSAPAAPGPVRLLGDLGGGFAVDVVADYPVLTLDPAPLTVIDSRTLTDMKGGQYLVWNAYGRIVVTITRLAGQSAVLSGVFVDPVKAQQTPQVAFVKADTTTAGNWIGVYGVKGALVAADTGKGTQAGPQAPSFAWSIDSTDPRSLQRVNLPGRVQAAWYGETMTVNVDLGYPPASQLAIYVADYDNSGRAQRVDVAVPTLASLSGWEIAATVDGQVVRSQMHETFPEEDKGQAHFRVTPDLLPNVGQAYGVAIRYRQWVTVDQTQPHTERFSAWQTATGKVQKLANGRLVVVP